ncbi:metalloregulator ArsR/SmtB family transcription factor [Vibrio sp.]|nr:metalloregulator ArsR/SmtB family transcription factor [Vibrio sp.]
MTNTDIKENAAKAAQWLKLLSHPERLFVLCQLIQGEKSVNALQKHSELTQSALSQHLALLRNHDLVSTRKDAKHIFYSLKDESVIAVIQILYAKFCTNKE